MFRFSIREMMLVTLVVGMAVAWWLDRSNLAYDAGRYKTALMKLRRIGLDVGTILNNQKLASEVEAASDAEYARKPSRPKSAGKK